MPNTNFERSWPYRVAHDASPKRIKPGEEGIVKLEVFNNLETPADVLVEFFIDKDKNDK